MSTILLLDPSGSMEPRISAAVDGWAETPAVLGFTEFGTLAGEIEGGSGHAALVVAPVDDVEEILAKIRIVHEEVPSIPVVLVLPRGAWLEPVELVRIGAVELLPDNVETEELNAALSRVVRIGQQVNRGIEAEPPRVEKTTTVSFVSSTGGTGRTFFATNMASWFRREGYEKVCLIDLSGPYSAVATALRLRNDYTVQQACRATVEPTELIEHLSDYMTTHRDGFDLLASGDSPMEWLSMPPEAVATLIRIVQSVYDAVVIDTAAGYNPVIEEIVALSTRTCVVATLDIPSLRSLRMYLEQLRAIGLSDRELRIALNRVTTGLGIEIGEALEYLDSELAGWVPSDDDVRRSMNLGKVMMSDRPRHDVTEHLGRTMWQIEANPDDSDKPPPPPTNGHPVAHDGETDQDRNLKSRFLLPRLTRTR